jgi:hypothetical protein
MEGWKMKKFFAVLVTLVLLSGCEVPGNKVSEEKKMKVLTVSWQRLVDEKGETCERCGSTEKELEEALARLKESLRSLKIEVVLEKKVLDPETCAKDILQSNRIWISERPLEEWLGAKVDKSACGFCCADLGNTVECRTMTVGGQTYETIPAKLIIKAGLLAGSQLLEAPPGDSCCQAPRSIQKESSKCCPASAECQDK